MALLRVENTEKIDKMRNTIHRPVNATYTTFEANGRIIFQIDTYGSPDREMPEKISQAIQIDKEMATFLIKKFEETFKL